MRIPETYRVLNRLLSPVLPGFMGRLASKLFLTARPSHGSAAVGGAASVVALGNGAHAWVYGSGPAVFLLHGWSAGPGSLSPFVSPLLERGYQVVAIRAPGHDPDSPGQSHPTAFMDSLLRAREILGRPAVVIGHSMGAGSALAAQSQGLGAGRLVLIAGPASVSGVFDRFIRQSALSEAAGKAFRREVVQAAGRDESFFDAARYAGEVDAPVLLVHDMGDQEIPYAEAQALLGILPRSQLLTTSGLGHRRILRDTRMLNDVLAFVTSRPPHPSNLPASGESRHGLAPA
ncbi:alpha/beta fold hydrolase [Arenimonas donghaensis]|uniref:AB hydrolase-1 domain-containing protein n=1 Tax=Arenimonas donghaensis DSM 18148 = HO3-R19 TaxID=1121014 RepID=A0A087MGN0_9GAMM|nr:alpha/beta fold hydrolase [Arenimonas donghaensis]KFL36033.1 hypothetical protein N788_05670 [Arenimonas donghaensis DSM 18148 = HO3-R19]